MTVDKDKCIVQSTKQSTHFWHKWNPIVFCHCVSARSRVRSSARSPVHVCFVVLHTVRVFIGCVHSCYILCCVLCEHVSREFSHYLCVYFLFCTWLLICLLAMCLFLFCVSTWLLSSFLFAMCSHVNLS